MDKSLRDFVIKFGVVIGSIAVLTFAALTTRSCYDGYVERKKEEAHLKAQATVRQMIQFCDFTKLSDDEQASLNRCGDDVEAVRFRLSQIIDDRIIFWRGRVNDALEAIAKIENVKRNATYWTDGNEHAYREALAKVAAGGKQAVDQHESWSRKKKDLQLWAPGKDVKTLEHSKPAKSSDDMKV